MSTTHDARSVFPPLQPGDRLSRDEFHRRYSARPDIKKAELIAGVVHVASPVSGWHGAPHARAVGWLYAYKAGRSGIAIVDNTTVFLSADSEVQPDAALFWTTPGRGAGARFDERGYVHGPPDLVVEVSVSSAAHDLQQKKREYDRAGVPEYVVWHVVGARIEWFILRDGVYMPHVPDEDGVIRSETFPGLNLDPSAMLAGDDARVLSLLKDESPDPHKSSD